MAMARQDLVHGMYRARPVPARHNRRQKACLRRFVRTHAQWDAATARASGRKPIVIPFTDDSTLFFALRMRAQLQAAAHAPPVRLGWVTDQNALSDRQMSQRLPDGPDLIIRDTQFEDLVLGGKTLAIVTSRMFRPLGKVMKRQHVRHAKDRACVIGFLGGLDFVPERGYAHRRHCDGVYVFPRSEVPTVSEMMCGYDVGWQDIGFGHPTAIGPKPPPEDLEARRDIYFFTQAISPNTSLGRRHMLEICVALARAYPDRTVWIKLRHLPEENKAHLHKERFDYPGLLDTIRDVPGNVRLTACSMQDAMATMAVGITCTSTAALDIVSEGIPCLVYLDYVDNFCDPLVAPMRRLFADSGLITSLEDMLHLRAQAPDRDWTAAMFCPPDLGARVLDTVARFQARPLPVPEPAAAGTAPLDRETGSA
jgi:hypothetical protein